MNAIFLCAGYGTRLHPLTKDKPKPLLPIGGRALLNHLIEKLEAIKSLDQIVIVSNALFYQQFVQWKKTISTKKKITIVNDGTSHNDQRLGAIQDLKLGMKACIKQSDLMVLAGDNLFDTDLSEFASYVASKRPAVTVVGVYDVQDRTLASKYGLIKTDSSGKIIAFLEKPKDPLTTLASMGIYFFPKETLAYVDRYLQSHGNPDAPGFYISWLTDQIDVYAFPFKGTWFDIGDLNSYYKADEFFKKLVIPARFKRESTNLDPR